LCGYPLCAAACGLQGVATPRLAESQCAGSQRLESTDLLDQTAAAAVSDSRRSIVPIPFPREAVQFSVGAAREHVEPESPRDARHGPGRERISFAVLWGSRRTQQFGPARILPSHHLYRKFGSRRRACCRGKISRVPSPGASEGSGSSRGMTGEASIKTPRRRAPVRRRCLVRDAQRRCGEVLPSAPVEQSVPDRSSSPTMSW
jgi:hypothetical protein